MICWAGPCFFTWGGGRGEDSDLLGWAVFFLLGEEGGEDSDLFGWAVFLYLGRRGEKTVICLAGLCFFTWGGGGRRQ